MPRNKYPEETVTRILDVSLKLFSEQGYNQVKMQDIVDALGGLTKGAVYHHFKNKEDIFDALLDRYYYALEPMHAIQNSDLSGLEKLKKSCPSGSGRQHTKPGNTSHSQTGCSKHRVFSSGRWKTAKRRLPQFF
ncbi:TetR/AcrR family transcriptional regulator [Hungatella hathewayi]|uniref:HTH tetR-type domain-containing protein n=1 Tax=Hungatella hathewayi WAL-18680 TaxID=742737 RepID=G5IIC3_9FIRM|nr:TetR/AcrR family transcriptional regulator [Hungatella hathewayi]EHI58770.1 hypothetical protein HMPREF9473_03251 [ [Hungatella hathewayi WAL-18680]